MITLNDGWIERVDHTQEVIEDQESCGMLQVNYQKFQNFKVENQIGKISFTMEAGYSYSIQFRT